MIAGEGWREGGEKETSPSPESALHSTHITANVSLWAARCHSFSAEYREGSRMHVRRGRAAEKQHPTKARVRIMTNLHLNNSRLKLNKSYDSKSS